MGRKDLDVRRRASKIPLTWTNPAEIAREDRRNPDQEIEWLIEQKRLKRKKIT